MDVIVKHIHEPEPERAGAAAQHAAAQVPDGPTLAVIFNDRSGPTQVREIIEREHAFVRFEAIDTRDESGNPAYLLVVWCETATADQLYGMIGNRLPDYVRARRFPPSRLADLLPDG